MLRQLGADVDHLTRLDWPGNVRELRKQWSAVLMQDPELCQDITSDVRPRTTAPPDPRR